VAAIKARGASVGALRAEEGVRWPRRHIEGAQWGRESGAIVGRMPGRGEGASAAGHGARLKVGDSPDIGDPVVGERERGRRWVSRRCLLGRERGKGRWVANGLERKTKKKKRRERMEGWSRGRYGPEQDFWAGGGK
jgi:hypothetical protein